MSGGDTVDFGEHPLTIKLMRGLFKSRPSTPRYSEAWDVIVLLIYLKGFVNDSCSLKDLPVKCFALMAVASGQRVQTWANFYILSQCLITATPFVICKLPHLVSTE